MSGSKALNTKRLIATLAAMVTTGCATIHRHPKAFAVVGGATVGAVVVGMTMKPGHCASTYEGKPYFGTPPCPK
jgi:hypothetical protein